MNQNKNLRTMLLPFLTLLLIISGATMPFAVARLQDLQTEKITDIRQFSSVNLTLQQNSAISHVLQLINSADYSWLDYRGSTRLTSDEVTSILQTEMLEMSANGLINNIDYSDADLQPRLALITMAENSAIIWVCNFYYNENRNYFAIIDDTSAKIVMLWTDSPRISIEPMESKKLFIVTKSMNGQGDTFMLVDENIDYQQKVLVIDDKQIAYEYAEPEESIYETENLTEDKFPLLIKWRSFCEDYYDIKIEEVEKNYSRDYIQYVMKYRLDEQDVWYELPITIYPDYTILN